VPDNLRVMSARRPHWRLAMYDEYIACLKQRVLYHRLERDEALLKGWIDLRAEFLGELNQLAREKERKAASA
jgi:hypothetical protein